MLIDKIEMEFGLGLCVLSYADIVNLWYRVVIDLSIPLKSTEKSPIPGMLNR